MIVVQEKIFQEVQGAAKKAWPFQIKNNNTILAILVHGFTGTPYDLWVLADFLAANPIFECFRFSPIRPALFLNLSRLFPKLP